MTTIELTPKIQAKEAERLLNETAAYLAATLAKPDPRAWAHLLVYAPRPRDEIREIFRQFNSGTISMMQAVDAVLDAARLSEDRQRTAS